MVPKNYQYFKNFKFTLEFILRISGKNLIRRKNFKVTTALPSTTPTLFVKITR